MTTRANTFLLLVCTLLAKQFCDGFRLIPSTIGSIKFGRQSRSSSLASSTASKYYNFLRDQLETPPESIISAVESIGPNAPISVGDASALSGTDLNTARRNLMTLATLTGGDLEVTPDGEIMYSFPKGVRSVLERRSLGQKIKMKYTSAYPYLYYGMRASFGVLLLTSLAIIVITILVASESSSGDSKDDRKNSHGDRDRTSSALNFHMPYVGIDVPDLFYSRQYMGYYQSPRFQHDYSQPTLSKGHQVSFIEGFFSYVFGDGDPNSGR